MSGCDIASRDMPEDSGEDPKRFDFGFAFNNADFADRVVRLLITSDTIDERDADFCHLELEKTSSGGEEERLSLEEDDFGGRPLRSAGYMQRDEYSGDPDQAGSMPALPYSSPSTSRVPLPPATTNFGSPRHCSPASAPMSPTHPTTSSSSPFSSVTDTETATTSQQPSPAPAASPFASLPVTPPVSSLVEGTITLPSSSPPSEAPSDAIVAPAYRSSGFSRASSAPSSSSSPSLILRTVDLHLSSVVLAAKSSFFRTLFTCGLKEALCGSSPVELTLTVDEEGPVIDLLRFIYTGDMSSPNSGSSSPVSSCSSRSDPVSSTIRMFLVADKFGVSSATKICLDRLVSLPLTVPTACTYLSLPDSMHAHRGVASLLDAARRFLVAHFRDLDRVKSSDDFLSLPLVGLQTLLASDDLHVRDEMVAFSAMVEWVRCNHADMEDRRRTASRLAEFVRFPLISGDDLEDLVLKTPEMDSPLCQSLIREAAWFRSYSLVRQLRLMNETGTLHRRFWKRSWNRNAVGHVYFDIHLERFQALAVGSTVESATFGIGGKRFYLSARHGRRDDGTETLDIHLHLENSQGVHPEIQVSFIFYAKRWPEGQFDYLRDRVTKGFGRNASNWGYSNILGRPWAEVVQDDSKYFHNGVMAVFAEVQLLEHESALGAGRGSASSS